MIRNLEKKELMQSLELSQYAFRYTLSKEEIEKRLNNLDPATVYGTFDENGKLLAKLHLLPFEAYFGGKSVKMGGLAGVATWPENRRKGLVRELLRHSLEAMNSSGTYLSMLHPFSVKFYRSFGWELTCDYKKYKIHKTQFPPFHEVSGSVERLTSNDGHILYPIYERFSERYNGSLKRNEAWWNNNVLRDLKIALYRGKNNEGKGYILYSIKDKVMVIDEFVALDRESWEGLWNFIRNHDSMIEEATIIAPPDDELGYYLEDPKIHQEQHSYFMGRIVNVLEALKDYPFNQIEGGTLFLHVEDAFAEWNRGTYAITAEGSRPNINFFPAKAGEKSCQVTPKRGITLGIRELSAILFNYKKPKDLLLHGRIYGKEEDITLFESLLPEHTPFIYDFF
ncbi:GNAT family N-acetyltransferase [Fictibacillus sp. NRS-1165]|uniref:GNAT family N-acetyltransferase n=1 Tax=Fictibacillus sp. NRS-1165 TaxID=3144463 RepID=UPI003D1D61B5